MRLKKYPITFVFLTIFISISCSPTPPKVIINDFLETVENAAENNHARILINLISENYQDTHVRTRKDISAYIIGYLFRNKSIHIIYKIISVNQETEDTISATLIAALAGKPIDNDELLVSLHADIYWFDITIHKESGDWKLIYSTWRQAMVEDFIGE